MYKCCNLKKIIHILIILTLIFSTGGILIFLAKHFFFSSAAEKDESPVPLPVIMYHSVYGTQPSEYIVTPSQLENDLIWLRNNGYISVTAAELTNYTNGHGDLPEKPVLITLDDGFYNNLSELLPLLEKYDMHAVVSVVGRYTEAIAPKDPHSSAYSYLTWEDISQLAASGRVEIGNHTYDMHCGNGIRHGCSIAAGETEEEYHNVLFSDLSLLQEELHRCTGITPIVFAYPFGYISRESLPVIRECGFLITLTCYERMNYITRDPDCLLGLSRYNRSGLYSTEEFMYRLTKENNTR